MVREYVHIVFANEEEARAFTGHTDPHKALDTIALLCPDSRCENRRKGSLMNQEGKTYTYSSNPRKMYRHHGSR